MKSPFTILIIVMLGVFTATSVCAPELLVENEFLKNFINHELLNILSVIMTITIASVANMHLAFNRAEESLNKEGHFKDARDEVNGSAKWLIYLFIFTIILLFTRSYFINTISLVAFFNGLGLLVLLTNILVLFDITLAVFELHPFFPKDSESES